MSEQRATVARLLALLSKPMTFALMLGILAVLVMVGVVALQRYSSAAYRTSVLTYELGLDAQALNALTWLSMSAVDTVHFPSDEERPPVGVIADLDAALLHASEHLDETPTDVQQAIGPYVAMTARIAEMIRERNTEEAWPLLNETTIGETSLLARLIGDVQVVGDGYERKAERAADFSVVASVAIIALGFAAGGTSYAGFRISRRKIEHAEAEHEIMRRSEARFRPLVHHSTDVIAVLDREARVQYVSPAIERMLGVDTHALGGQRLVSLAPAEERQSLESFISGVAARPDYTASTETGLLGSGGEGHRFEVVATNLLDDPDVGGLVLNMRDVSERKAMEEQLVHLAFHDGLTNLSNRLRFVDRLEHALLRGKGEPSGKVTVLYLDLDHFKTVNDQAGHAGGDALLKEVAVRIRACIRPADTAARLGGDEFAVLLDEPGTIADARGVAERLLADLSRPFTLGSREVAVSASIGIVVADPMTTNADEVIRDADIAMYDAKENGRGRAHVFEHGMHVSLVERARLVQELNAGVDADEFVILYQPIMNLESEQPIGFEALLRWNHPQRGLLPPSEFISLAEETGAIISLGEVILMRACQQLKDWQAAYPKSAGLTMAVNVSAKQIEHVGFVETVGRALGESGIEPHLLTLEITESVLVTRPLRAIGTLEGLKRLGVRLALDDFGTGYSSLSYLKRFPIDTLKVDRSFVEGVGGAGRDRMLVQTVIDLGRTLDLQIVAEGIERPEQLEWLRTVQCERGQGYLFAMPLDLIAAGELVARADLRKSENDGAAGEQHRPTLVA